MTEHTDTVGKHAHPAVFGLLVLPFGLTYGYLQVAVPLLLKDRGISMAEIGAVSAIASFPHGIKFLWTPALDAGWPRRKWYIAMIALTAASLALTALIPPDPSRSAGPVTLLMLFAIALTIAQAAVATSNSAVNALMATTIPNEKKGAVSGWSMAGNVGGTGIGGGVALWLAHHVEGRTSAIILAATCLACAIPAFFMDEKRPEQHPLGRLFKVLLKDIWATVRSREGWTGIVICFAPIGTGAATNLFSALASDYLFAPEGGSASAAACFGTAPVVDRAFCVEVVGGLLAGVVGALGCLLGGWMSGRMRPRVAYVVGGVLTALAAIAMAGLDATPRSFTWGMLLYSFVNGISFAAFAAMVLEIVGDSAGVTTKYALYVGVSNQAISYVTWLDAQGSDWGRAHFADPAKGARWGLLGVDAAVTFVGIALLGAMLWSLRKTKLTPASA
jgi:MFS family permease